MNPVSRRLLLAAGAAAMASTPLAGWAQSNYPERPVRLVAGFPPGTAPDVLARLLGARLGELMKQQVFIENKAGAGGQIAAQTVAKSQPDGYTLYLGDVGSIAIAPAAFSKLPYNPSKEFVGVSEVASVDFLLAVPANSPHRTVGDFVKANKGRADPVNFATFGAGSPGHFGVDLFAAAAGLKVEPIHYRSTGDAVTSIVVGDVAGAFVSTALGAAQIKGGKMRALATTAPQRSPLLPDVPTFTEAGIPKIDISSWFVVLAPAGTPSNIIDTLNRHLVTAMKTPETAAKIIEAGFSVSGTSRADTERLLKAEWPRWAGIVKASGFKGD